MGSRAPTVRTTSPQQIRIIFRHEDALTDQVGTATKEPVF